MNNNIEKDIKKHFNLGYVAKCLKYSLPYKKLIVLCVALIIVSALVGVATPKIDTYLTSTVLPNGQTRTFFWVILGIAVLNFSSIIADYFKSRLIYKFGYDIIQKIRSDVYDKLTALSLDYFDKNTTGSLITKSTTYVDNIASFYTSYVFTFIEQFIKICMVVPFLFATSPIIALVGFGVIIPIGIVVHFIMKLSNKRSKKYYESYSARSSSVVENINGVNTMNSFNMQEKNCEKYLETVKQNYKDWYALSRAENSYHFWFNTIYNVAIASIFVLCFVFILKGQFTFAKYVAYIGYQGQLWNPFNYFVQMFNSFSSLTGGLQQVFNTLDIEEKISDKNYAKDYNLKGDILISNVSFKYEDKLALNNVTLKINAGSITAISGLSNSGKSTLVEIIGRLYDFDDGSISIDGIDIKSIKQKSIHNNIDIIQSNSFIFQDSIINNIKFGNKKVSDETCIDVCKQIGLHDMVTELGGYQTILDENVILNEQTKQLINLARALVANKNIVIYDEALSSLQQEQETKVVSQIIKMLPGKTLILITNNVEILKYCDYIYYLKDGNIIEQGDFNTITKSTKFNNDIITNYLKKKKS